ncbi:MAG TPA: hypothetical protein VJN88_11035 [Ktedonobacterales bacterium]|nr:hypothetical protein [Ktedonobacterales bacterium]
MAANVQELLEAARSLPPDKQIELLHGLAQSLAQVSSPLASASSEFWSRRSLDELAQRQRVTALHDAGSLVMLDWPTDESADDLIAFVRNQRDSDRDR